ncbi:hypothetical protein FRC08_014620 [Ceratobasidium sp. 394]|nr:hypothetical protein FRC08_014620 [Ceratobasidium sp. 394]KAG9093879.1 hypothetical protein FS749_013586 [Ceratobasidium sp. UAMH 11750]
MFSRLSAFLSLVVTTMLVFFAPLIAGLIMVSVVFVSSILYAADTISATLVRLVAKLYSRIAARLPSVAPALVAVRGLADTWVPPFVEPLNGVLGLPFSYRRPYFAIDIFVSSLAVPLSYAVDTELFEYLRVSFFLAYFSTTYAFATRSIPSGARFLPTALGVGLIPIFTWVVVTLDLRWIMYHPSSAIFGHLFLLIVGLIVYDHQVRTATRSRSSQPRTTPNTPDELPAPVRTSILSQRNGSPTDSKHPPVLPKPRRARFRPKQGAPKRYITAKLKSDPQEPNRITDHDNQPASTSLVVRPKLHVSSTLPRSQDLDKSSPVRATDVGQQPQAGARPAMRLARIQGPAVRRCIEAPPPMSTMDASDDESVPTCARLMEVVAQRNNWPKPSAPKYELIGASPRPQSNQAGAEGEELWRKHKWYLPVPIVPDRERTPYSFCSRRSAEKWPTEWSGVRDRERTPYEYRPRSGFARVEYVAASDEMVVMGIQERTRTPYQIVAYKEWMCVSRGKLPLALPAPDHAAEANAEAPTLIQTPSERIITPNGDSDDSSGPLTSSDPAPTVQDEILDRPLPAVPVIGKRSRDCDLSDSPSKRHRGDNLEPQGETGPTCATEVPAADDSGNDSTTSTNSTSSLDSTSSSESTSSSSITPDSSFDISSPPCYTPLKRACDDATLDTPPKRHCGGRKLAYDVDATWMRQDTPENDPAHLEDHAPPPTGIHPVGENDQSAASLPEDLPSQQPEPDKSAASVGAVGYPNATAPAAFAPLSGSVAGSFASSSSQQLTVLPRTFGFNFGSHPVAPPPFGQPLGPFIADPPPQAATPTAHSIGTQVDGFENVFSSLGPTSGLPQLDAETEMLVDQAVHEMLQDGLETHAGEMVVDDEDEWMSTWLNPDVFAMDHDAPECTSGEPIEVDLELPSTSSRGRSPSPMEMSSPVLDGANELPGSPIDVDHPTQDGHQAWPVDTPQLFVAPPALSSPDTAMAPAVPQPVDPPATWLSAAMAQALPQDEDEEEVIIPADTETASAAQNEPASPAPAPSTPAPPASPLTPSKPATPPTWANRANADQVDGLGTAGANEDAPSPSREAIARKWKERMRRRLL